jgi:hypothetical protein
MEYIEKGEMVTASGSCDDNLTHLDYPGMAQSIGTAIAFVVVIIGWATSKIFRKDLLW